MKCCELSKEFVVSNRGRGDYKPILIETRSGDVHTVLCKRFRSHVKFSFICKRRRVMQLTATTTSQEHGSLLYVHYQKINYSTLTAW